MQEPDMPAGLGPFTRIFFKIFGGPLAELDRIHDDVLRHNEELPRLDTALQAEAAKRRAQVTELEATIAALETRGGVLHDEYQATASGFAQRQEEFEAALGKVRPYITHHRGLPDEGSFELYALASRYSRFVLSDLMDLASFARSGMGPGAEGRHGNRLPAETERLDGDPPLDPLRREAQLVRLLVQNLLLGTDGPDETAVRAQFPPGLTKADRKKLDAAIGEARELHKEMAARGAGFEPWATAGERSRGAVLLWPNCEPGTIEFVVAPAFVVKGSRVADQSGTVAGPWVFTRAPSGPRSITAGQG
jgi:hypothetical protein